MNCLTDLETAKWLRDHSVTPYTYDNSERPTYYIQFRAPATNLGVEELIASLCNSNRETADFLIHVTDWSAYTSEQMDAYNSFRHTYDERRLVDANGHLFLPNEQKFAARLFALATSFGWSSYLYFPNDITTLYNWEGDLYDYWSRDLSRLNGTKKLIGQLELDITHAG